MMNTDAPKTIGSYRIPQTNLEPFHALKVLSICLGHEIKEGALPLPPGARTAPDCELHLIPVEGCCC